MKTIVPILAMMFLVGCGNNSMNESSSTNSASTQPPVNSNDTNIPSTNDVINQMTNTSAISNSVVDTNLPASTNQ